MNGILYGVGVGPGDPELMTLKAARLINENEIIAVPGKVPEETVAYKIAIQAVPTLANKKLLPIYMPMTHNKEEMKKKHAEGALHIEGYLKACKNVVFLTLGDPTIYSTFSYIQKIVNDHGYKTELVSGITSFCAAAARINISLAEWNEPLHIIPAVHKNENILNEEGNYILMKTGSHMKQVKDMLVKSGKNVYMAENCGMENEHIYLNAEDIPEDAGYYSLIIAKEKPER